MSDYLTSNITSIANAINTYTDSIYTSSTNTLYYDANAGTITGTWSATEETYPNELKINIKKSQIKFNFNL